MKNQPPEIEMPEDVGICDDCKKVFLLDNLKKCPICKKTLCDLCFDLDSKDHIEEMYGEADEEDDVEWGTNKGDE